jgi:hypothetical protein
MEPITQLFVPALRAACFLKEWARFIRAKASADSLSIVILEGLRNPDDNAGRMAFAHFAQFMKSRNWNESRAELLDHFEEADRTALDDPYAEDLYERLKAIICGQIEEYYAQFIEEQNKKRKDLKTVIEADPYQNLEARISAMIDTKLEVSMEILKETIVEELKKHMGDGENWKT